jgi:hypothetical protein
MGRGREQDHGRGAHGGRQVAHPRVASEVRAGLLKDACESVKRRFDQRERREIEHAPKLIDRLHVGGPLVDEHLATGLDGHPPDHLGEPFGRPALGVPTGAGVDDEERPPVIPSEPGQGEAGMSAPGFRRPQEYGRRRRVHSPRGEGSQKVLPNCGRGSCLRYGRREQRIGNDRAQAFAEEIGPGTKPGDDAVEVCQARTGLRGNSIAGEECLKPEPVEGERRVHQAGSAEQPPEMRLAGEGEMVTFGESAERNERRDRLKHIPQGARVNN